MWVLIELRLNQLITSTLFETDEQLNSPLSTSLFTQGFLLLFQVRGQDCWGQNLHPPYLSEHSPAIPKRT